MKIKALIRLLESCLKEQGNLEVVYSVPGHTMYSDKPVRTVGIQEYGALPKKVEISS